LEISRDRLLVLSGSCIEMLGINHWVIIDWNFYVLVKAIKQKPLVQRKDQIWTAL
jgi:hypothetical protein